MSLINSRVVVFSQDTELHYTWIHNPVPGFAVEDILGKTDADLLSREDADRLTAIKRQVLESGVGTREEIQASVGGEVTFHDLTVEPLRDAKGTIVGITGASFDITEAKRAEEALRHRAQLLANLNDAVVAADKNFVWTSWNPSAERMYGWKEDEVIGRPSGEILHPEFIGIDAAEVFRILRETGQWRGEVIQYNKDGGEIYTEANAYALRDQNGDITGYVSVDRDITERRRADEEIKAALKEKEVLLKEIHHRVKNNLQIISSLLNLQTRPVKDELALAILKDSQSRVKSLVLIHERLYRSDDLARIDFTEYVRALAADLFRSYGDDSGAITLKTNVDDVSLEIDTAIPCGLIINELVSNSLKHAFPGDKEGEVRIGLHSDSDHELTLIISDNGVGLPKGVDFRDTESLGLQLVCDLTDQLGGTIELDSSGGTEFALISPPPEFE